MSIRLCLFFIAALFSLQVLASDVRYFPGPAQSPTGTSSILDMLGKGHIVYPGNPNFKIGFNEYKPRWNSDHCSADGKVYFECNNSDSSFRGANANLKLIDDDELDPREFPGQWNGSRDKLSPKDPHFKTVRVSQNLELEPGVYYFGQLIVNNGKSIKVNGKVEIHVNQLHMSNGAKFNYNGTPEDVTIWVHGYDEVIEYLPSVQMNNSANIQGYIYSEATVAFSNNSHVIGAVTARRVTMNNDSSITYSPLDMKYKLMMTPKNTYSSSCSRVPITFQVVDADGNVDADISGKLIARITRQEEYSCLSTSLTSPCLSNPTTVNLSKGRRTLWLQSNADNTVNVNAKFDSTETGELFEVGGRYRFAPVSFRVNPEPAKMVAGKPQFLSLEAVASTSGNCEVVGNYKGIKTLAIGKVKYQSPNYLDDIEAPEKIQFLNVPLIKYKYVEFVNGLAKNAFEVKYDDAGQVSFDLYEFDLSEIEPPLPQNKETVDEDDRVRGTAFLDVRPYTLAICDINASDKGHSTASDAFTYAGAPFSVNLKPVIWLDGDKDDESKINLWSEDYCSRPSTPSFWHVNAPEATVTIRNKARIAFPVLGSSTNVEGAVVQSNIDAVNGVYAFPSLKVNDVGIFKLRSKVNGRYLDMKVNRGDMHIGRFYPSHFSLASASKVSPGVEKAYDEKANGFTYLGQPFEGMFTVYAMTAQNKPVKNYHRYLDAGEKASFTDWVIHSNSHYPYTGQDLSSRWSHPELPSVQWTSGPGGYSEVSIGGLMEIQKASSPDGPFDPLHFAVGVAQSDRDNTDFKYCQSPDGTNCVDKVQNPQSKNFGAEFGRGDFLFGRMRIEGFTETQNLKREQTLPVTVEVFNGSHFVTNERDNATNISTEAGVAQKDVLFSDTTVEADRAKIVLKNSANEVVQTKRVEKGTSVFQVIPPNQSKGPNREQFRFWQKLGAPTKSGLRQTWLQYRWQGDSFNEDPSAIGTFGFYRGSDRVIFKGEKNITLTGE
ncbi:DUF6701 domain-containing protein [Enterovibrio norvegicus]|uniref:DUF6701 domain-containing protein n=1 Tax=Enterovibrio norvegicus TaxID=188144 RepID=UPI001F536EBF|nr:DUF6701 domain-containing protein [Enterovibrio norvegicus]